MRVSSRRSDSLATLPYTCSSCSIDTHTHTHTHTNACSRYTSNPRGLARQIEATAFEAATSSELYFQLLAIQTYKLRKLAQGELSMPPRAQMPRPSISIVASLVESDADETDDNSASGSAANSNGGTRPLAPTTAAAVATAASGSSTVGSNGSGGAGTGSGRAGASGGAGGAASFLAPAPGRFDTRLPSLPGMFTSDIDFADVDLLAWDPQAKYQ
jgi:hypothetical protein